MRRKPRTWEEHEPIILEHAGIIVADEIALILGISKGGLTSMCSRRNISLKVHGLKHTRTVREPKPEPIDANKLWRTTSLK